MTILDFITVGALIVSIVSGTFFPRFWISTIIMALVAMIVSLFKFGEFFPSWPLFAATWIFYAAISGAIHAIRWVISRRGKVE